MILKFTDKLILVAALICFFFISVVPIRVWDKEFPAGTGPEKKIIVEPGKSAIEIAHSMVRQDLTTDAVEIAKWMLRTGIDRNLRPGTYTLRKGTPWEVVKQLTLAKPSYFKMTIIPGGGRNELCKNFSESTSSQDLEAALSGENNYPEDLRPFLPDKIRNRIVFLLPETYYCPGAAPVYLVRQASAMWNGKMESLLHRKQLTKAQLHDFAIIASLVEKEAMFDDERPIISGVILNRLNKGMPLQIDASIIYAWKQEGRDLKKVMYKDLDINSPFNTYKHKGLPPDPICIPSLASWKAAVHPDENQYLYYVADKGGKHIFSTKYSDHIKAINKIRK